MLTRTRVISRATEPPAVSLAEARGHLRQRGLSYPDDSDLALKIQAATEFVESITGRFYSPAVIEVSSQPPEGTELLLLPGGPVESVDALEYLDAAGTAYPVTATDYIVASYEGSPAMLRPGGALQWESTRYPEIRIRLSVGHAPVPALVKSAILLVVGHLYLNREANTEIKLHELPLSVRDLLHNERITYGV